MPVYVIDSPTLKQWLEDNDVLLIDVRELSEYQDGHIATATLMPVSTLKTEDVPVEHERKLVFYCRLGKRSLMACEIALMHGASHDVYSLEGGIVAWSQHGYSIEHEFLEK